MPEVLVCQPGRGPNGNRQQRLYSLFLFENLTVDTYAIMGSVQGYADAAQDPWPMSFNQFEVMNSVVTTFDYNADGIVDIAHGNMGEEHDAVETGFISKGGAVHTLYMRANGTASDMKNIGTGGFAGAVEPGDRLGASVDLLSDVGADGIQDLVIGTPGKDSERGGFWIAQLRADGRVQTGGYDVAFFLFVGAGQGPYNTGTRIPRTLTGITNGPGDRFGEAVCNIGDLDLNGVEDIAVGAPGANKVYITFMTISSATPTFVSATVIDPSTGSNSGGLTVPSDAEFGDGIVNPGDLDGDGVMDLMVGAPGDDGGNGRVYTFLMRTDGTVKAYTSVGRDDLKEPFAEGARFGAALRRGWNFTTNGRGGILVGAPADTVNGQEFSGSLFFYQPYAVCISPPVADGTECVAEMGETCVVTCDPGFYVVGDPPLCNATSLWTAELVGSVQTCTACSTCGAQFGMLTPCGVSTDTVCYACPAGEWSGAGDANCHACEDNPLCASGLKCTGANATGEECASCAAGGYLDGTCIACEANPLCAGTVTCTGGGRAGEACPDGCVDRIAVDVDGVCTEAQPVETSSRVSLTVRTPTELNVTAFILALADQLDVHPDRINVTVTEDDGLQVSLDILFESRLEGERGLSPEDAVVAVRVATSNGDDVGGLEPISVTVSTEEVAGERLTLGAVTPSLSVLAGGDDHSLAGTKFDSNCLVFVDDMMVPRANVTISSPTSLTFAAPALPREAHYADIKVVSGGGAVATLFDGLYYTDDCPMEGMFGRGRDCAECPEGAICPGGYRMWAKKGYWTPDETAGYVVQCPDPAEVRCKGGRGGMVDCGAGYTEVACGSCEEGYQDYFGECVPCDGDTARRFAALLLSGILFLIFFVIAALFAPDPKLTMIVEILASAQIVGALAKLGSPYSPGFVKRIQSIYSLLLLDFEYLEPGCNLGSSGFVDVFWANVAFAVAMFLICQVGLTALYLARPAHAFFYRHRMVRVFGVLLHMFYANLVVRALEAFYCVDVGDGEEYRLKHDYKIRCFTGEHLPIFIVSLLIAVYGIAFPSSVLFFLTRKATYFTKPSFYAKFGYFFELYHRHDYYYTCLLIMVTLIITIASTMAKTWTRFAIVVGVLGSLLILVIARRPYIKRYKNITSAAALTVPITASIYDVLLSAGVLPVSSPATISIGYVISIFLVAFLVAIFTTVLSVPVSALLGRKHVYYPELEQVYELDPNRSADDDKIYTKTRNLNDSADSALSLSNVPLMGRIFSEGTLDRCTERDTEESLQEEEEEEEGGAGEEGLGGRTGVDDDGGSGSSDSSNLPNAVVMQKSAVVTNDAYAGSEKESSSTPAPADHGALTRHLSAEDEIEFMIAQLPTDSDGGQPSVG